MTQQTLPKLIGEPVRRREDPRLITGQATYVDDIKLPGMMHMAIVRSTHAHARVTGLDAAAARGQPGVALVITGTDVRAWSEELPLAANLPDMLAAKRYALAADEVRYVGEPVAAVVAPDRYAARDAAELVQVEYAELPVVVDPLRAIEPGAPLVHAQFGTNVAATVTMGDKQAADAAFAAADVTIRQRMVNHRLVPNAMEPRGIVAHYEPGPETLTVWSSTQIPHLLRAFLSHVLRLPAHKMRVIAPEVGGAFGSKLNVYPEEVLACLASIRLGRPVKWIEERSENFLATTHGRDIHAEVELAARSDGRLLGQRIRAIADIGAYQATFGAGIPPAVSNLFPGLYDIPAFAGEVLEVFTNKTPVDAYRGAGRPEAAYFLERAMDMLARKLDMDPAELRRRNFIQPGAFPYKTKANLTYDSGNYEPALDLALRTAGYQELRQRQQEARQQGRYLGIGLSAYVEICGMGPSADMGGSGWEAGTVRVDAGGKVTVLTGASPHGQGEETAFAQLVAEELGVPIDDVTVLHGDTGQVAFGVGTFGSRALAVGGAAVMMSVVKVKEKAKRFAAHLLEAQAADLVYERGKVFLPGHEDSGLTLQEIAAEAWSAVKLPPDTEPGLEFTSYFEPSNFTYPFGVHVAVVEIDPETGKTDLQRYIAVDDCGNVINPMLVEGQVHGGIAQGVGQALMEEAVYGDDGQLLTGSFMDYNLPRADQLPSFELARTVTPTPVNPLGAKGVGEAGTIGATPAVVNAVVDALAPLGIEHVDMMLRPEKIWRILQGGRP